jgi:hypothetical protein
MNDFWKKLKEKQGNIAGMKDEGRVWKQIWLVHKLFADICGSAFSFNSYLFSISDRIFFYVERSNFII